MNKQKLSILQVIKRDGVSQKTGRPWAIHSAQCVLEQDVDGQKQLLVGTINLPDERKAKKGRKPALARLFIDGYISIRALHFF